MEQVGSYDWSDTYLGGSRGVHAHPFSLWALDV